MRAVGVCDFAGGFAAGVVQAGLEYVAKREPSAFGGFGVASVERNFHDVQIEVTEPELWSMVKADVLFGCPPCSGFSMLSAVNTADSKTGKMVDGVRVAQRGVESPDNKWMTDLVRYSAKVRPEVAIFESVPGGGKLGAPLMRQLWQLLRDETGLDYQFTDVFMNAALVGGDVIRPRYFWVAHLRPFGVDLPRMTPRTLMEVIGDLPEAEDESPADADWGHVTNGSRSSQRLAATIRDLRADGDDWLQGTRLPQNLERYINTDDSHEVPDYWRKPDGSLLSHAVSDNLYSPFRWRADKPMGVVTGGFMDRAIHPIAPRPFTYREGARFMGLPDWWSLYPIVAGKKDAWLGKAIPVASGKWIATWAKASIEGDPGEYAGIEVEPGHRVIDVTNADKVRLIERDQESPVWWHREEDRPRRVYSAPERGERRTRSTTPWSRVRRERGLSLPGVETVATAPRTPREREARAPRPIAGPIVRVAPERVQALIDAAGLTRSQAAQALGLSPSRLAEMTGRNRPGSWLNAERLPEVEARLAGASLSPD